MENNAEIERITAAFKDFIRTIIELRERCPWDREQTLYTLRKFLIEESFEATTAIHDGNNEQIMDELGDVLLVALMMSWVAEQENKFALDQMLKAATEKLIRRHPHVYKNAQSGKTPEQVRKKWDEIKTTEEGKIDIDATASFPPMERAGRIQRKARKMGFNWQNTSQIFDKVREELNELEAEITLLQKNDNQEKLEGEFGDFLFSVISIAALLKIDPGLSLHRTNEKFLRRFHYLQKKLQDLEVEMHADNLDIMTNIWNEAKQYE